MNTVGNVVEATGLVKHRGEFTLGPLDLHKLTFYATKLDHLLCLPALFFLFIGMRSFYHSVAKEHARGSR